MIILFFNKNPLLIIVFFYWIIFLKSARIGSEIKNKQSMEE